MTRCTPSSKISNPILRPRLPVAVRQDRAHAIATVERKAVLGDALLRAVRDLPHLVGWAVTVAHVAHGAHHHDALLELWAVVALQRIGTLSCCARALPDLQHPRHGMEASLAGVEHVRALREGCSIARDSRALVGVVLEHACSEVHAN